MDHSDNSLLAQLTKKCGLANPHVMEKASEFLRLLQLKSSQIISVVGDYGKTMICIDLASEVLGIPCDMEDCLKVSGLRRTVYINHRRTIEKCLDINKAIGINEICIQLGLSNCNKRANEIMDIYKRSLGDNVNEIDLSHPQYAAMAVFQACKTTGQKISTKKLMLYSHLKQAQWAYLQKNWDKLLETNNLTKKKTKQSEPNLDTNVKIKAKSTKNKKITNEIESYETWKLRMLRFAEFYSDNDESMLDLNVKT